MSSGALWQNVLPQDFATKKTSKIHPNVRRKFIKLELKIDDFSPNFDLWSAGCVVTEGYICDHDPGPIFSDGLCASQWGLLISIMKNLGFCKDWERLLLWKAAFPKMKSSSSFWSRFGDGVLPWLPRLLSLKKHDRGQAVDYFVELFDEISPKLSRSFLCGKRFGKMDRHESSNES